MAIKNYTTTVDAGKTVSDLQNLLSRKGALRVQIEYEGGKPKSLSFTMMIGEQVVPFRLTADVGGCFAALRKQGVEPRYQTPAQAERVAWRLVYNWIDVQLAFAEAGQAALAQLLLGYTIQKSGQTFWEFIIDEPEGRKLLAEHL